MFMTVLASNNWISTCDSENLTKGIDVKLTYHTIYMLQECILWITNCPPWLGTGVVPNKKMYTKSSFYRVEMK